MPSKLTNKENIPNQPTPQFDGLEITGVYIVNHVQKASEEGFSGNIEIGDVIAYPRISQKKLAIHFMLLDGDIVTHKDVVELVDTNLTALLTGFPGLDLGVKSAAFQALLDANIIPADAVII